MLNSLKKLGNISFKLLSIFLNKENKLLTIKERRIKADKCDGMQQFKYKVNKIV